MRNLICQMQYKFGNSEKRWKKEAICDRINKETKTDCELNSLSDYWVKYEQNVNNSGNG